MTFLHLQF